MTRRRPRAGSRFRHGFSLIELMISITIGLIIISAVFSAYLGVAGASRMADAQSRMDEDAQSALTILAQQVRLAGVNPEQNWTNQLNYSTGTLIYNPVYLKAPLFATPTYVGPPNGPYDTTHAPFILPKYTNANGMSPFALSAYTLVGCQGSFDNVTQAANLDALTCGANTKAPNPPVPNSFGVNYEADANNTVSTTVGAVITPTDCLGIQLNAVVAKIPQPPPPPPAPAEGSTAPAPAPAYTTDAQYNPSFPYYVADNRFYIVAATQTTPPSLYCQGNGIGSVAQPLVENVEDMQITYGVQSPDVGNTAGSIAVAGYLTAAGLIAAVANPKAGWNKVLTVRICLQMRSATPVIANNASASYLKCDGTVDATQTDHRLRRTYTSTVVLRNKLL